MPFFAYRSGVGDGFRSLTVRVSRPDAKNGIAGGEDNSDEHGEGGRMSLGVCRRRPSKDTQTLASASAIAARWAGVLPQHAPMIRAPAAWKPRAASAMLAGSAR
jgi:hypothetical protein